MRWMHLALGLALFAFGCSKDHGTDPKPPITTPSTSQILIGQGVVLENRGIVIGDGEVLAGQALDRFLGEMSQSFHGVEVRVWTWFYGLDPDSKIVLSNFIAKAHEHGLKVWLNCWEYPGTAAPPDDYQAKKLSDTGEIVSAPYSDDHVKVNHVDKTNVEAMGWLAGQLTTALSQIDGFDGFLIVEDKVSSWVQDDPWPQRVRYWDSPTYSPTALLSFQRYLQRHGLPARKFPVDRPELVNTATELVPSGDALWLSWYQWRFEVFSEYLNVIRQAVKSVRPVPVVYMPWQRIVDEANATYENDWPGDKWDVGLGTGVRENAIFGVSAETIASAGPVDYFVIEYGEDGTHSHWPMSANGVNTQRVGELFRQSQTQFGTFVQLFNYSNRQTTPLELIADEVRMGLANNTQMIVVYDVATVYSGSSRYDAGVTEYWRRIVADGFHQLDGR